MTAAIRRAKPSAGKAEITSPRAPDWADRAEALIQKRSYAAAMRLLRAATDKKHVFPETRLKLARCQFHLGDVSSALKGLRRVATASAELRRAALEKLAVYCPDSPCLDNAGILKERRRWARLVERAEGRGHCAPIATSTRGRRLRIGYVSAFFADRNWMKPVWGMLDAHDRQDFEIHLFLDGGLPEKQYGYAPNEGDHVHALDKTTNEEAAQLISGERLDILVDLNGFSYPRRLGLFMRKPAPAQVGWFNTFATSGMKAFDFAIGDDVVLPREEERFYTERILRVRGSYLAFSVKYPVPDVVDPPSAESKGITFGCLAPQYKIVPDMIAAFAEILCAAPGARLLLKNTCLTDPGNRAIVRGLFRRRGISRRQLVCEGPVEHFEFLKTYDRIDIALDTIPYSGGTTTMEALWQGVPVLTFPGDRWVSRISSSLLRAARLHEWICESRKKYVRHAIELAKGSDTPAQLAVLRRSMRKRLTAAPICDFEDLCRQVEIHYQNIAGAKNG
jgi:predicted O-linked N-acetylglucosamine transferase (SPINDLY family)